eukprot:TRINITY_DN32950_c0_g1_i1.p2 TRINITY_DN32950_c0_g1~~TRINITY_DN32950_c0_g1_i1.p2  ORF type:complete len:208 (-),score=13.83 TRINITY_DN32950_c0_g1_i1:268-891(-)
MILVVIFLLTACVSGTPRKGGYYYNDYVYEPVVKKWDDEGYKGKYGGGGSTVDVLDTAENLHGYSLATTSVKSKDDISVDSSASVKPGESKARSIVKVEKPERCHQHCEKICPQPFKKCVKYDYKYHCKGCIKYERICEPVKVCVKHVCLEFHPYTYECVKPYCAEYKIKKECKKECVHYDCYPKKICVKEDIIYPPCEPVCEQICY